MDKRKEFNTKRLYFYNQFENKACGNCGETKNVNIHHVVPLSLGGNNVITNMVLLCEKCHGLIHGEDFMNFRRLQREGKKRAKQRPDFREGRPPKFSEEQIKYALSLVDKGLSYKQVSEITGMSKSTLIRAKRKSKLVIV
jgi:hypothetical protein